jgi:hypothetical protein
MDWNTFTICARSKSGLLIKRREYLLKCNLCDQQDGCLFIARDGDLYCPSFIFAIARDGASHVYYPSVIILAVK